MPNYKTEHERLRINIGLGSEGKNYNSGISSERLPSNLSVFTSFLE